ncbi:MAG: HvfA family oxazolone/thioamide-modified RiPP metallophore [Gammaproteobacteria bacterium]
MKKRAALRPISAAIGATFVVSMATIPIANAADNPFGFNELSGGYLLAEQEAGAEGKCAEGKCAEGKCSGGAKEGPAAAAEGKCGEGKCAEGKCSGGAKEGPPSE